MTPATSTGPPPGQACGVAPPYVNRLGEQQYREKIDLLAPHGLSGTASRTRRGVPALRAHHGKLAIGNALGLELAAFNRSPMTITDFADPLLSTEIHVAEIPALLLAKGSKVGERLLNLRKGQVRDKDIGDLWRLMAVADPGQASTLVAEYVDHPDVGADVCRATDWTRAVIADVVSRERAKRSFEGFVDPAEIDRTFDQWREAFPS